MNQYQLKQKICLDLSILYKLYYFDFDIPLYQYSVTSLNNKFNMNHITVLYIPSNHNSYGHVHMNMCIFCQLQIVYFSYFGHILIKFESRVIKFQESMSIDSIIWVGLICHYPEKC